MTTAQKTSPDRKQQVIAAAVRVFVAKGIQNTSMNEIILASGLSKGGVYHYFESKDDLVLGVLDVFLEIQRDALKLALAQEAPTRDRLETIVKAIANSDYVHTQSHYSDVRMSLDMLTLALDKPVFMTRMQQGYEELMGLLCPIIENGVQQGEFKADTNVRKVAMTISAIFDGLRLQQPLDKLNFDWAEIGLEAVNQLLDGISVPHTN